MNYSKKNWSVIIIAIILIIIFNFTLPNKTFTVLFTAVAGSIIASILVSFFYNEVVFKANSRYDKIGLIDYYDDFQNVQDQIRKSISNGKEVDIYVMYGSSFFNTSSNALKHLLSKRESKLRVFLFHKSNPFINSFGDFWGSNNKRYDSVGLNDLVME